MIALITFAIACIAALSVACNMYLLDQRAKLRDRVEWQNGVALAQADIIADLRYRELRLQQHCVEQIRLRRMAEAELMAVTQAPKFGVVTKGVA